MSPLLVFCVCLLGWEWLWCHEVADARTPGVGRHSLCNRHRGESSGLRTFPGGQTVGDGPAGAGESSVETRVASAGAVGSSRAAAASGVPSCAWLVLSSRVTVGPSRRGTPDVGQTMPSVVFRGLETTPTVFSEQIIEAHVLTTEFSMICRLMSTRRHNIESPLRRLLDKSFLWKLIQ